MPEENDGEKNRRFVVEILFPDGESTLLAISGQQEQAWVFDKLEHARRWAQLDSIRTTLRRYARDRDGCYYDADQVVGTRILELVALEEVRE